MQWITRQRIQVNRTATCWLIRRFLNKEAEFLFVPAESVAAAQAENKAIGFDAPGATYPHKSAEGLCSFAALVHERLAHDSVLVEMAHIVQAADFNDQLDDHPAARGLQLLSRGVPLVTKNDHETAERASFMYDALYASIAETLNNPGGIQKTLVGRLKKGRVEMSKQGGRVRGSGAQYSVESRARQLILTASAFLLAAVFILVSYSAPRGQNAQTNVGQQQQSGATDWKTVGQALGKEGTMQPGDVYKVSLPRSDLQVTAGGVQLKPALALGSWLAFKKMGNMTMVMGDLVLTEDEVTPVMTKLQEGGVEQTALHNHVLHESPRVMYMHISAMGDAVKIARAIHDALSLSKTPFTAPATPSAQNQDLGIDTKQLDRLMGQSGKVNSGVYQFSVPRAEAISDNGMEVPPSMGLATAINFQPTGGGKAAITGDFVMIASEVNPVIRALRDNGIEVTALHSHMLHENPRLFFMHFWANDDAQKLARGIRAALDKMNIRK